MLLARLLSLALLADGGVTPPKATSMNEQEVLELLPAERRWVRFPCEGRVTQTSSVPGVKVVEPRSTDAQGLLEVTDTPPGQSELSLECTNPAGNHYRYRVLQKVVDGAPLPNGTPIRLRENERRRVRVPCAIQRAAITSSTIELHTLAGGRELELIGRPVGRSGLALWCADGTRLVYPTWVEGAP